MGIEIVTNNMLLKLVQLGLFLLLPLQHRQAITSFPVRLGAYQFRQLDTMLSGLLVEVPLLHGCKQHLELHPRLVVASWVPPMNSVAGH